MNEQYHIVRCNGAGVFFGKIKERNGDEVTMTDARRLWYWSGAASLSQLAMEGVKNPRDCKFPTPVNEIVVFSVLEIIPCTDESVASVKAVPIWKM